MISHFISIREPYDEMILSGRKTVETRTMRMPEKYLNQTIGIYVPEKKKIVGTVQVVEQINYPDAKSFDADYPRHLVARGSAYYIKPGRKKVGLVLRFPRRIEHQSPSGRVYPSMINKNPASSAKTSRPIVPAGAKKINWQPGTVNLDIGGGKYELLTKWLAERGVTNLVYDEFNRSKEHNQSVLRKVTGQKADTGSIFNVLNVIPSREEALAVLQVARDYVAGAIFISVYEGDRSGVGKETRDGYQHNRVLADYLPLVRSVFPDARQTGILIVANWNIASNRRRRCWWWKGYEPVPGKKAYTKGSCRKIKRNPRPPATVAKVACRALEKRRKYKRGGTAVGVARARDLCNRKNVSMATVKRMSSYFARHRASRAESAKRMRDATSAAAIADELWGGTPGWAWAKRVG